MSEEIENKHLFRKRDDHGEKERQWGLSHALPSHLVVIRYPDKLLLSCSSRFLFFPTEQSTVKPSLFVTFYYILGGGGGVAVEQHFFSRMKTL